MTTFLIGRTDYDRARPQWLGDVVPIDCPHCGGGSVFPEPPYHPHKPVVWRCAGCRGQFSVHREVPA